MLRTTVVLLALAPCILQLLYKCGTYSVQAVTCKLWRQRDDDLSRVSALRHPRSVKEGTLWYQMDCAGLHVAHVAHVVPWLLSVGFVCRLALAWSSLALSPIPQPPPRISNSGLCSQAYYQERAVVRGTTRRMGPLVKAVGEAPSRTKFNTWLSCLGSSE